MEKIEAMNKAKNEMIAALRDEMFGKDFTQLSEADFKAFVVMSKALTAYTEVFEEIYMKLEYIETKIMEK